MFVPESETNPRMSNPFFETWSTPYGVPPFDAIETTHFRPAYAQALEEHSGEIAQIAARADAPTFENTIVALENAGKLLRRVEMIFGQLSSADTNDELQAVEREVVPLVTRHWTGIYRDRILGLPHIAEVEALMLVSTIKETGGLPL